VLIDTLQLECRIGNAQASVRPRRPGPSSVTKSRESRVRLFAGDKNPMFLSLIPARFFGESQGVALENTTNSYNALTE